MLGLRILHLQRRTIYESEERLEMVHEMCHVSDFHGKCVYTSDCGSKIRSLVDVGSILIDCIVTSQGERVPRGMGIQYSRTNILGDMS